MGLTALGLYSLSPIISIGGVFGSRHGNIVADAKGSIWHVYHLQWDESRGWNRFLSLDSLWFDEKSILHGNATGGSPQQAPQDGAGGSP